MSIASPSTFTMTQFVRLPMRAESARDLQYLRHIKYVGGTWRLVSKPPMVRTEARTQLLQQDRFEIPSDLHPAPTDLYAIPSAVATCDSLSPRQSIQPICIPAPTPRLNLDLYDSLPLNLTSKPDVLDEEDGMIFMTRGRRLVPVNTVSKRTIDSLHTPGKSSPVSGCAFEDPSGSDADSVDMLDVHSPSSELLHDNAAPLPRPDSQCVTPPIRRGCPLQLRLFRPKPSTKDDRRGTPDSHALIRPWSLRRFDRGLQCEFEISKECARRLRGQVQGRDGRFQEGLPLQRRLGH